MILSIPNVLSPEDAAAMRQRLDASDAGQLKERMREGIKLR